MQLWKILYHKLEKEQSKLETIFYICYFRARQNYGSNFGIIFFRVTKNSEFVMKNSQKCFLNHINIFEYLSIYMHVNGIDVRKQIVTKFTLSPFSAANLPQFFEYWKRTLVTNMQQSLLKRKDWRRLEEEWRGRIFKKKFMSWPKWNTPISFISIRSTKMGKMSYLSLSCKSSYKFLFYYI